MFFLFLGLLILYKSCTLSLSLHPFPELLIKIKITDFACDYVHVCTCCVGMHLHVCKCLSRPEVDSNIFLDCVASFCYYLTFPVVCVHVCMHVCVSMHTIVHV